MNSKENGRNITVFQLSLGLINSKVKIQADKGRKCPTKTISKKFKVFFKRHSLFIILIFLFPFCSILYCSTAYLSKAEDDSILSST